jgi:PAS domain S-box-containing protein
MRSILLRSLTRLFVSVVAVVVLADLVAMAVVVHLPVRLTPWQAPITDSLLLALFLAPVLWWTGSSLLKSRTVRDLSRSRAIVDASSDAIVTLSDRALIESFNPAAARLYGWQEDEIVGQPFDILVAEPERAQRRSEFEADLRHAEGTSSRTVGDVASVRKDGSPFVAALTVSSFGRPDHRTIVAVLRDVTESTRSWDRLQAQERHFRSLFENSTDITTLLSAEGTVLYESPAFERVLGYPVENWRGESVFGLIWPDDLPAATALFEQSVRSPGVPVPLRLRLRHADGTARWVEGIGTNLADDAAVGGIVVNTRDITERHRAEERLLQLSRAVEYSPASIVITDPAGAIEYVNPAFTARTGYTLEEVRGQNPRILNSGRLPKSVYRDLWDTILGGGEWRGELHNRSRSGELFWEHASISGILDDQGRITRFVAVKEDITERKRAEESLRASEERFQKAFSNAAIGMALVGTDGRWLKVNRALCRLVGYTANQLLARNFQDITHPEDLEADLGFLRQLLAGEISSYQMEKRYIHRHGHMIWVQLNVSLVADPEQRPLYLIAQIQDITARKAAQDELERWARDLAAANATLQRERTEREKVETELRLAQKLEAIGQLAAGIAHEINTPLQYVGDSVHFLAQSWGQVVRHLDGLEAARTDTATPPREEVPQADPTDLDYLRERIPRALHRTLEGINRVTAIVRAMKEFAHPDSSGKTAVDINRALETALIVARNEYKYVADVETDFGTVPPVSCHAGEVNQVLLNLIVNAGHAIGEAVKGTDRKGLIRIRTAVARNAVTIDIEDNGTGIPAAIRDRVFDPFFTTKPVGKGTGQGLAIARAIVDRHAGSLTFTSEAGQGTTFTVSLPLGVSAQEAEGVTA